MKTRLNYLLILILWINSGGIFAQDGEGLFKSKCNTCHDLKKNSTGPMLQGVKQKWIDAGEGDMIYEWVSNSDILISSGKSNMAKAIEGFSVTKMPAQDVKKEQVDAILDYVDNWTAPAPVAKTDATGEPEITLLPNYTTNLNVFYALIVMAIILLIAIAMMSGAIKRYISTDYFKTRLALKEEENATENNDSKSGGLKNLLLIIIGTFFIANSASALDFLQPGESVDGQPWLLVENSDLYALVGLNVLLLGVLLYMKRLFNGFVEMVTEKKEADEKEPAVMQKVNKLLTDVVPIEEEESILLHHEYDGIRELDNNLPPWWVWMFYGTIIFAVVYIFNYHILGTSDLQIVAYEKEIDQADREIAAYRKAMAMNIDETNATLMTDAADLSKGKAIFTANCVVCHGQKGEGDNGPNLTDNNWIYGYDIKDIFATVRLGRPNGMPEHESKINPIEIQQVASYVLSLPDADGKEPQGDIIQK